MYKCEGEYLANELGSDGRGVRITVGTVMFSRLLYMYTHKHC